MICPNHPEARVRGLGGFSTLPGGSGPYWELGVKHVHDPNESTQGYRCAEGCLLSESHFRPCPAPDCDYGSEPTKFTIEPPEGNQP